MPYCEFIIKSNAFYRMERDKWKHTRKIAFWSMWGSHADAKKFPNTESRFLPLDDEPIIKKADDNQKDQLFREQLDFLLKSNKIEEYKKALKNYNDGKI